MIDALIAGKLYGQPQGRKGTKGKPYALAKVRVATSKGETLFVSVIAFDAAATALLAMEDGDGVALVGSITPTAWADKQTGEPRAGLDMQAQKALSVYQMQKKRQQHSG